MHRACSAELPQGRPSLEVADIVRLHGPAYRMRHQLGRAQQKTLVDLERCRTAALGGHLEICSTCAYSRPAYNSCRNRHCPKCQSLSQARWIDKRLARLLPTHYFHVVFTVPAPVRALALRNRALVFNLLFACAAKTLLALGADPRRLGATLGLTAVLHTWSRELNWHPHVHAIVTGGGLSPDGEHWSPARKKFLFPVQVLSELFRGKMLAAIARAHRRGVLNLDGVLDPADKKAFRHWLDALYRSPWVVYAKRPFGGPEQVFRYLGRYTHRVGISNHRLVSMDEQGVCFRTKDGQRVIVAPEEFLRRFLLHVLPRGFVKIRHFGLMASGNATTKLEQARARLAPPESPVSLPALPAPQTPRDWRALLLDLTGFDVTLCPRCRTDTMQRIPLPEPFRSPSATVSSPDTS